MMTPTVTEERPSNCLKMPDVGFKGQAFAKRGCQLNLQTV